MMFLEANLNERHAPQHDQIQLFVLLSLTTSSFILLPCSKKTIPHFKNQTGFESLAA